MAAARSGWAGPLLTAAIAVPANLLFGLAASWAIARFELHLHRADEAGADEADAELLHQATTS